jgi:hypothetical protein
MAKVTVILDENNKVLGAVRSGPVQVGNITVQLRPHLSAKHKHHELEVPDEAMRSADDLRKHLLGKAAAR